LQLYRINLDTMETWINSGDFWDALTVDVGVLDNGSDNDSEFLDVSLQIVIFGNVASAEELLAQWTRRAFLPQDSFYTGLAE